MTNEERAREWVARIWDDPSDELVAIRSLLAEVRRETIEECGALLGKEVLRLLGQRDREDVDGIARASKLVRDMNEAEPMPSREPGPVCARTLDVEIASPPEVQQRVANRVAAAMSSDSSGTAHYLRDEVLARLSAWAHEYGAALRPTGADTYGEGMRDAKAQVAAILSSPFTSQTTEKK